MNSKFCLTETRELKKKKKKKEKRGKPWNENADAESKPALKFTATYHFVFKIKEDFQFKKY